MISGDSPLLVLHGTLTTDSLTLDNHGRFNLAGRLIASSLTLESWSETTVASTALFGNDGQKISISTFELGFAAQIIFDRDEIIFESTSFKMYSLSNFILTGDTKKVSIITDDFTVQDGAVINLSESGYLETGPGSSSGTEGASHGGDGGGNGVTKTYGSTISPDDYGSGTIGARGGGVIHIEATSTADIDGNLHVDGQGSTTTGGASGGSIYISAGTLQGHGQLRANGGASSSGGGGGGGRIAIIASSQSDFLGAATAYGGNGTLEDGAAGIVYKEYSQSGGSMVKKAVIDNNGLISEAFSFLTDVEELSELEVRGYGQVKSTITSTTFIVKTVTGDNTGTLTVSQNQVYDIATSYGTLSPYALKFKLIIESNGQVTAPAKILLTDDDVTGTDWFNLEIYGTLIGVREMTVSSGGKALIHSSSRTGFSEDSLQPIGTMSLNKIDVTTNGILEISKDSMDMYTLDMIEKLTVKYGGVLTSRSLAIVSPTTEVAFNGHLNVDGGDMNIVESGTTGAGGSHGGAGGASSEGIQPAVNYTGEFMHVESGTPGSNGQSENGTKAGGHLMIDTTTLTVHGMISADGEDAIVDAGGGSGGGIKILVHEDIDGSGSISVRGGSAVLGGGGGGGRIVLDVHGNFHFLGDYKLRGGSSTDGQAGGSGTSFVTFQGTDVPGYVQYLYVNNLYALGKTEGVTYLDTLGIDVLDLDNINIGDATLLWISTPGLHVRAKTLTCGSSSTIVVDNDVIFSADVELTYSAITCSFDLKQAGELRLSKSVELRGEESKFEGEDPVWVSSSFINFVGTVILLSFYPFLVGKQLFYP